MSQVTGTPASRHAGRRQRRLRVDVVDVHEARGADEVARQAVDRVLQIRIAMPEHQTLARRINEDGGAGGGRGVATTCVTSTPRAASSRQIIRPSSSSPTTPT